jgi:UPF0176 protein
MAAMPTHDEPQIAPICIAALYHFAPITDPEAVRLRLEGLCTEHGIHGLLLIACEGVNGTVAGLPDDIAALVNALREMPHCADLEVKYSHAETMPFPRLNVRVKAEIVTMGLPDIDPLSSVGTYVEPQDWNTLISDPDTILIDTRNDYEVAIGTFAGAIDPKTTSFREFPEWFRQHREELLGEGRSPKVAMFCTGGIRCEKSTAFLKQEGVEDVFHLKGGILKYLEDMPEENSLWEGECFVFDQRVSVRHGLEQGSYGQCFACRRPVRDEDMQSAEYEEGVSCPACYGERSSAQRAAYRERQKQVLLSEAKGKAHVGVKWQGPQS